ncbi:MAG: hypothetical protein WA268_12715 [Xanthobacteraceae bacterium]
MIARIEEPRPLAPVFAIAELATESDVEQKLVYPFLCHTSYLGIPTSWVRTKDYMEPTQIDKGAGKRVGYIPDYSIWKGGFPLLIIEAKSPEETIDRGLREALMYAAEINKRYPPGINPIGHVLACNGEHFALCPSDSETEVIKVRCAEVQPGSSSLAAFLDTLSPSELGERASAVALQFQSRRFHKVAAQMTRAQYNEQLGINEFAHQLFPLITQYFGAEADEATDDIIDRGYVTSSERTEYGAVLEGFLKDRARVAATAHLKPIVTARDSAGEIDKELRRYSQSPNFYGRVQLIVGSVGAGKSIFIQRFYRRILDQEIKARTMWAFINFNVQFSAGTNLRNIIADRLIESLEGLNGLDLRTLEMAEKFFGPEMRRFDYGPAKQLRPLNEQQFQHQRYLHMRELMEDRETLVKAISRHFIGEKGKGIVCVFDNVDKRSRDLQLEIFEAAQWLKDITRALVIVNLRDTTFEAHRDEKPLDAFINAVNFYISPPRFAVVIQKRLELVLDKMKTDERFTGQHTFTLETGAKISYDSTRLVEFLTSIYDSLFKTGSNISASMQSLVAKNVRVALGMFGDIISSPHVSSAQMTSVAMTGSANRIEEEGILRALMRGRYRLFGNRGPYIRNIIGVAPESKRPSNFLYADILEFLIRNRKAKVDFSVEGYASGEVIVKRMTQLGYDEEDAFRGLSQLVNWNLVEPESLVLEELKLGDAVQVHASGYTHMRYFLQKPEYVVSISADMSFSSFETASNISNIWSQAGHGEPGFRARQRILAQMVTYARAEYARRLRRHAFYEDLGYGGKHVVRSLETAYNATTGAVHRTRGKIRSQPPRTI